MPDLSLPMRQNSARRGTTTLWFAGQQDLGDGMAANSAYEGVDDPSGTWIITIGELVGPPELDVPNASGELMEKSKRLRGPWILNVEVP